MSRCRFVYPQLPLERIIQLLNQVATVTRTDLTEPNSDFITNIFPPILVYIDCLREDHRLVEFADLEQLNSPDMHVDSVKMINLYHTIKKVIAALDCPKQFNLKDIVKPEADRTEFFFSTILNFCVHRDHRMNKLQPMVGEIKVLAYQGRELDERISQLNDEISELNEAKEREMPFVQEIATKIKEMQQEITALNNQLHSLKSTISKASTEMDQKISSADLALKRTAQENRSLHFKFVQSLDKLQDKKKDVGKWRTKAFPHYDDLCTVFGNNLARGNGAKDCGDVVKEAHIVVLESDEEVETMMEGSHDAPRKTNVQVKDNTNFEVDETTNAQRKRQIDLLVEGSHDAPRKTNVQVKDNTNIEVDETTNAQRKRKIDLLVDLLGKVATTISRDIDFEEDLKKKKSMTTNEIFKMESLSQQEKYEVMEKIRSDIEYVEAYWAMDQENREGWVKYMLLKD